MGISSNRPSYHAGAATGYLLALLSYLVNGISAGGSIHNAADPLNGEAFLRCTSRRSIHLTFEWEIA